MRRFIPMTSISLLFFSLLSMPILAQNLVPNPGFEQTIPDNQVVHWHQPPTTNYHHKKEGKHGQPYADEFMSGICISNLHFSECMFVVLDDSLRKGKTYNLSFFARQQPGTDDCFNYDACDEIQAYFTRKASPTLPRTPYAVKEDKLLRIPLPDSASGDRLQWKKYEATYTAAGGEQILAFSYFMRQDTTKPLYLPAGAVHQGVKLPKAVKIIDKEGDNPIMEYYGSGDEAFRVRYYFDEVSLTSASPETKAMKIEELPEQLEAGQKFTLRNIHFEFDKTDLLSSAYPTLDKLTRLLKTNPALKVKIIAHTDSQGTEEYNLKLSQGRAQSVANYLSRQGISKSRLTTVGKGENEPVASNESPEGRAQNRRVDFEILE